VMRLRLRNCDDREDAMETAQHCRRCRSVIRYEEKESQLFPNIHFIILLSAKLR
jgi:hypothetical protein